MINNLDLFANNPIDDEKLVSLKALFAENTSKSGIDVISGMSGGRDSIYQAFLLTQVLDKNVLSFTWGNDFLTEDARNAIFKSISTFRKMQMHIFSISQDVYSLYFKSMHSVFKRFCLCAHTMMLKAFPYACNYDIPFICVGYSPDQIDGKSGYSYGTRDERIKRICEYIIAYRKMVLYAVKITEPTMVNRVDSELFYQALNMLDNIESYRVIPGMLMLAEYMPWDYKMVEKVVYDTYALKSEGKNCLHSNCLYEPVRGYVEAIMKRPFLQNEAKYIVGKGGLSQNEAELALKQINLINKEPQVLSQFLNMIKMDKNDFYGKLYRPMDEKSVDLLSNFLDSMVKLQGYTITKPIKVVT